MNEEKKRVFSRIFSDLPRQGPGSDAMTREALQRLPELPDQPRIIDLGCGTGAQTMVLAEETNGTILAVDFMEEFIRILKERITDYGLADRITPMCRSFADLPEVGRHDLLWSEGAVYNLGFFNGLRHWHPLLRTGGFAAVSDACWIKSKPPYKISRFWQDAYPGMLSTDDALAVAAAPNSGYRVLDHFVLPSSAWWADYYQPLEKQIARLSKNRDKDALTQKICADLESEIEMFKKYGEFYSYVFFLLEAV